MGDYVFETKTAKCHPDFNTTSKDWRDSAAGVKWRNKQPDTFTKAKRKEFQAALHSGFKERGKAKRGKETA